MRQPSKMDNVRFAQAMLRELRQLSVRRMESTCSPTCLTWPTLKRVTALAPVGPHRSRIKMYCHAGRTGSLHLVEGVAQG